MPPCRPPLVAKHDFQRLASSVVSEASGETQAQRFGPSPLDTIPPNLYLRFPRFSTTTETSSPDLSTEEVISTRLSIDEHAMVQASDSPSVSSETGGKRQRLQGVLHRAISTPSLGYQMMRDRLRRAPSSTLSGKTLRQGRTPTPEEDSQVRYDLPIC